MALFNYMKTQEEETCSKKGSRKVHKIYVLISNIVCKYVRKKKS